MAKHSAGLLLHRRRAGRVEVFLVHPGGPFWARKDAGAWTIPKGEPLADEAALACARRELEEETGVTVEGPFAPLSPVRQKAGKRVQAWAVEADCDAAAIRSNSTTVEWPPRSGRTIEVPEVDRAAWFDLPTARTKINPAQAAFLDELEGFLALASGASGE